MSLDVFLAVQSARALLNEGHPLERAATVAALEFGVSPEEVARLALEAHQACSTARAHRTQKNARPAGGPAVALPESAADGEPQQ